MCRLLVLIAALCSSCAAITLTPERPRARPSNNKLLALRGGEGLTLPKAAAAANMATWGFYGANLWIQPNFILQKIMMASSAMEFLAPNYAVAQYLGAFYLAGTARMYRAFKEPTMTKTDLYGAGLVNTLLCLTSIGRIVGGVPANSVTLGLVAGQGAMAALSWVGHTKA